MKKSFWGIVLTLIACLCLCFGLAACGEKEEPPVGDNNTQTEQGGGNQNDNNNEPAPSHKHTFSEQWASDETSHWHAATCGDSEISGKAAHTYVNGVCSTCNHAHENHVYGNWVEKEKPTCTADGYQEHTCSVCGKSERQTLTHTGHTYDKGVCSVCGSVEGLVAFRTLEVSDDDTVYGKVSNKTQTFSFIQEVIAADDVTFTVSYDLGGKNTIPSKTVSLSIGDNTYYVLASRGNLLKLYTVTVRRRPVYNVKFSTSGSAVSSQQVEEDQDIVQPAATARTGYTFRKWTLGGTEATFPHKAEEGIPQTSGYNVTFTAVFAANDYKATLDAKGGEVAKGEQTVTFDQSYNFPVPTRTGYTFTGWYEGQNQLTNASGASLSAWKYAEGKQLDAHWSANSYLLTVEGNLSDAGTVTGGGTFAYDSDVTVTATTNKGYNFLGWYNEANERVSEQANYTFRMGFAKTLTAKWDFYTVTVLNSDAVAGTISQSYSDEKISVGEQVSITATTNKGYTFLGWYSGETEISTDETYYFTMGRENVNLIAKWTFYTVTVSRNDTAAGTISQSYSEEKISAGEQITVSVKTTNLGYTFLGWYSGDDELTTELAYSFTMGRENVDCEARWKVSPEMENFIFTSDTTTCTLTSIKDNTATEIIVPDYVTRIYGGAFKGCSRVESIVVPFVGGSVGTTTYERNPFGYIFGTTEFADTSAVTQGYLRLGTGKVNTYSSTYYIPNSLKEVTITSGGIDIWAFEDCSMLESVTIADNATFIGKSAFLNCSSLKSIVIPANVTSIAEYVFNNCTMLEKVFWNAEECEEAGYYSSQYNETIFKGCPNLKSVMFGETVKIIPANAFLGCSGLKDITIPDSVTSIGNYAFYGCSGLTGELKIPDNVTSIGSGAFSGCSGLESVTIGSGVTTIGTEVFYGCAQLKRLEWNAEQCMSVGHSQYRGVFSGCVELKSIIFSNKIQSIPDYLFYDSNFETELKIPNSVTSIGEYAFYGCSGLTGELNIPDGVTSIGDEAFRSCSGLTGVYISDLAAWCRIDFGSCYANPLLYAHHLYLDGKEVKDLTIPAEITEIKKYAFLGCSGLTGELKIPNGVISIGDQAFNSCGFENVIWNAENCTSVGNYSYPIFGNCTKLKTVTFGENVKIIPAYAFYNCSALTNVVIGNGVTSIVWSAFSGCSRLENITVDVGNPNYNSQDGIIYNKERTEIVFIPQAIKGVVTIPDGVTSIGNSAFSSRSKLTSVTIGSGVTSIGNNAFKNCTGLQSIIWNAENCSVAWTYSDKGFIGCDNLKTVTFGETVKTIPTYAFSGCRGLESVMIGSGVTSIGYYAFENCSGLTGVYITGLAAWCEIDFESYDANPLCYARHLYLDGNEVKNLTIPATVTEIKQYVFYNCIGLKSIEIPVGVTKIGGSAFYGCSKLIEVWNYSGLKFTEGNSDNGCISYYAKHVYTDDSPSKQVIKDDYLFYEEGEEAYLLGYVGESTELTLPTCSPSGNNYAIWQYAFYGCSGLTGELNIPDSVTSIGNYVFYGCSGLKGELKIPDSVTSIGNYVFYGCSGLKGELKIPDSVTSIGNYAFYGCSGLTNITIPNGVTSIGSSAFYGCSRLTGVYITDLAAWCKIDFGDFRDNPLYYARHLYLDGNEVKNLTIPAEITEIKEYAFSGCSGLTNITIPNGVTSIGHDAFYYCSGLESITIGEGVTSIGSYAFYKCSELKSVTIGSSVASIGNSAFYDCSVKTVYYKGTPSAWGGISIGDSNYSLTNATRYYYSAQTPSAEQWAESPNWWHYEADGETIVLWTKEQA